VTAEELPELLRVISVGFGEFLEPGLLEQERVLMPLDRTLAAVVDGGFVAGAADYPFELTVPGGSSVPVAGVTAVAVLPTHRRRGILRSLMQRQLDQVVARREPIAILNASESDIYGRFGYGLAQQYQSVEIAAQEMRFAVEPPACTFRLVAQQDAPQELPSIYEPYRRAQPGSLSRSDGWWGAMLGDFEGWKGGGKLFVVVAEPLDGSTGGFVIYQLKSLGGDGLQHRLVVRELAAADPAVEAALWDFCASVDLVDVVEAKGRPLDDPLRWRLVEPRQLRVTRQADYLFVRLLDIERALSARLYSEAGDLVVEVEDSFCPDVAGRYRLSVSSGSVACERTSSLADLRLDVADLGALYLSGVSPSLLTRAGRIEELTPGALALADRMFAWPVLPHCTTFF
jgi:predicted acetyltransferase